jgi:predicted 3-demethylubiquinone-9 3-methyltransferase (glyoxalase superfamily)
MQKLMTCLGFNDRAEEAVNFYLSSFRNSKLRSISRFGPTGPGPVGSVMAIAFELDGQAFLALNGGPPFTFTIGMSLIVNCDTQEEIDHYWEKLCEGGSPGPCGWLTDKFGVSWQIVPTSIAEMMTDKDPARVDRVMAAVMQMSKLDAAKLREVYEAK